jgi:hypothetical protein
MGHTRICGLPRTREWREVVALVAGGAHAAQVANAVMRAAERGLRLSADHRGLVEAFWLLTQLPAAARKGDFAAGLRERGLRVPDAPGVVELAAAVSEAVDARQPNNAGRTDLGELAQAAAAEAIVHAVADRVGGLFAATAEDVSQCFAGLGSVKQFGAFARQFYARLTDKVLQYYVSRTSADQVGDGRRFPTLAAKAAFDRAMALHCHESAAIVERFAGEWLSTTNWERGGVDREAASGFAHVAMGKMVSELSLRNN